MEKQDFKNVAKSEFKGKTLDVVNRQIDDFYELEKQIFKNAKYKVEKMKELVFVTGGNQGEALALVNALLNKGCNVCVLDKEIDNLKKIVSKNLIYFQVDVSNESHLYQIKEKLAGFKISALFLNASDAIFCEAEKNDLKAIEKVYSGNVYGTILCCSVFYSMLKNDAKIVFLNARSASQKGIANQTLFCSAKWAIEGFSQSIKKACENNDIMVYNVYCGSMDTDFWTKKAINMPVKKPKNLIDVNDLAQIIINNVFNNMDAVVGDIVVERRKNG